MDPFNKYLADRAVQELSTKVKEELIESLIQKRMTKFRKQIKMYQDAMKIS